MVGAEVSDLGQALGGLGTAWLDWISLGLPLRFSSLYGFYSLDGGAKRSIAGGSLWIDEDHSEWMMLCTNAAGASWQG
jgi:hypothetical protein